MLCEKYYKFEFHCNWKYKTNVHNDDRVYFDWHWSLDSRIVKWMHTKITHTNLFELYIWAEQIGQKCTALCACVCFVVSLTFVFDFNFDFDFHFL